VEGEEFFNKSGIDGREMGLTCWRKTEKTNFGQSKDKIQDCKGKANEKERIYEIGRETDGNE